MTIAVFGRKPKVKKISVAASLVILLVFTNHFVMYLVLKLWEPTPVAIETLPTYDIGIVLGCFRKAGLTPDSFPAEHIARYDKVYWAEWLRPDPAALRNWDSVINEWVGIVVYKAQKYM